jgi:hypothetical protein
MTDRQDWIVVANVGQSRGAARTDASGDMEQMELMDVIEISRHASRAAAERAAQEKNDRRDGWTYAVMSRQDFDAVTTQAA